MSEVSSEEILSHLQRFQERLRQNSIDAALILQGADMFYLSGTVQDGFLYVPASGEPLLLVRKSFARAIDEARCCKVLKLARFSELPKRLAGEGLPAGATVGLELDVVPASILFRLQDALPNANFVDVSRLLLLCRAVKTELEKQMLKEAGKIALNVFSKIPELIRPQMREFELCAEIDRVARLSGHQGAVRVRKWNANIFSSPVVSGPSACVPNLFDGPVGSPGTCAAVPIGPGTRRIGPGEPVMVDMVLGYAGYCVDITRVFAIGRIDPDLIEAHKLARSILREVEAILVEGTPARQIYEAARARAQESGFAEGFMGLGESKVRFVGHGVGLELDELPVIAPRFDQPLSASNVVAVEPKFFFEGQGGVGLENTYIVGETACENITPAAEEIVIV